MRLAAAWETPCRPTGEEADGHGCSVPNHACPGTSAGDGKASPGSPESVRPTSAYRQLGKTFYMAVKGGEVVDGAAHAMVNHPLPIPPSRVWFALFGLCQVESTLIFPEPSF